MKAATAAGKLILMHDGISIHAAREGGDPSRRHGRHTDMVISIHAAREGGDAWELVPDPDAVDFNPRRP